MTMTMVLRGKRRSKGQWKRNDGNGCSIWVGTIEEFKNCPDVLETELREVLQAQQDLCRTLGRVEIAISFGPSLIPFIEVNVGVGYRLRSPNP